MYWKFARPLSAGCTLLSLVVLAVGCGKSESGATADASASGGAKAQGIMSSAAGDMSGAVDSVSQFLDAIRRGGDSDRAHALLTARAAKVLEGLGRTIQPIGSPDATFKVTRGEAVAEHPGMALVHSTWSEPSPEGAAETYQVVWAVQFEQGWKISGMAMELDPEKPPMIVDFEDAQQMAQLFRSDSPEPAAGDAGVRTAGATEAAAPSAPAKAF
jgi:hypothetical protein